MTEQGREQGVLLPFYLVADVSYSMDGEKLARVNEILTDLVDALAKNPILSDKVRFGMIDFADDARVVLTLCDLAEQDRLPMLTCRGGTSFAAAFDMVRKQIESDASQLRADGFKVHRPAMFFLSDGQPTDDTPVWQSAFAALTEYDRQSGTGNKWYPNVIPFGVGDADPATMAQLIYPKKRSKMYMSAEGADAAGAIRSMAEILIASVLSSGYSAAEGGSGIVLPDKDEVPDNVDVYDDWLE
jgi:uncharacterized protein YegL